MRPRKLVWTEGLFITQHHFQQLDRYHEQLLADRMQSAMPYGWGVTSIEIDDRALAAGQLKINKLTAVMPDGTPIMLGDNLDDQIPPRPIDTSFPVTARSLDVWVGISDDNETGANVDVENRPRALTRFIREQAPVFDYNTGVNEQPIMWARRNLRILLGDERREATYAIRIAQITRSSAGVLMLSEAFIPPILQVSASPFLIEGFGRLLKNMTAKQRNISETRRQRTAAAVEYQASDSAKFWLLHTLNTSIPSFAHIVDRQTSHPEFAYLALAQLIGQLCTFAVDGDPTTIPQFNYLELSDVLAPMLTRATSLLDAVLAERFVEIPLTKREDGMYLGKIDDPAVLRHEFYVAASGNIPEAIMRDRLPKLSKIASWNHISSILQSSTNGAKLDLEYRPPGALPIRPGLIFFKVTRAPDFWNDISATGTIAIFQPLEPNSVNLSLYAVDPANIE